MAKLSLFNLFSSTNNRTGKGVSKDEAEFDGKYNFVNFFKLYKRSFGNLTKANLMFALLCIPLVFVLFPISGNFTEEAATPSNMLYPLVDALSVGGNPAAMVYYNIFAVNTSIRVWTVTAKVFLYMGLGVLFTFGFANTGMAYITRASVRRDHIYPWSDFFGCIKRNWRQSLILGFLDLVISAILIYDIIAYNVNRTEFYLQMFFFVIIVISVLYFIMRFYMYLIMITFDMPLIKIFKNSLIFTVLGFKRNICSAIGSVILVFFTFYSIILFQTIGYILPFVLTISLFSFMTTYTSWPVIDKYMIKPYYDEHKDETDKPDESDPVFRDNG